MKNRILIVLALVLAVLGVFAVHSLDFPGSVPNFERASGGGVLLDVKPSFSEQATYQRLAEYGEEGRKNYAFRNLTIDFLLPLAVFPALLLLMLHALKRFSPGGFPRAFLHYLTVVKRTASLLALAIALVIFGGALVRKGRAKG